MVTFYLCVTLAIKVNSAWKTLSLCVIAASENQLLTFRYLPIAADYLALALRICKEDNVLLLPVIPPIVSLLNAYTP